MSCGGHGARELEHLGWGGCRRSSEGSGKALGGFRNTMSPSDRGWFEPRREVLTMLSPGRIARVQMQPAAVCSLAEKEEIRGKRESSRRKIVKCRGHRNGF